MKGQSMNQVWARALARTLGLCAAIGSLGCGERTAAARSSALGEQGRPPVETVDHLVEHVSTAPLSAGETILLYVRELRAVGERPHAKAVLMLHGASIPALAGFDLRSEDEGTPPEGAARGTTYSWGLALATAGIDVFILELQGSGRSHRPVEMKDPCNVPLADQLRALIPNPLSATCPPTSTLPLVTSASDWGEIDTVVDFIRQRRGVDKVHLVAWSQGSFRAGPYSVLHPEKVASLFLIAPIYNVNFRPGTGPDAPPTTPPPPGTPMSLRTRANVMDQWLPEGKCEGQIEGGIPDRVWEAIREEDELGSTWGPPAPGEDVPEGVLRVRTPFLWGWNAGTAARVTVPILIFQGEFDRGGGGLQMLAELYQTVASTKKLRFRVQCAGHFVPWEARRDLLHDLSREWIEKGSAAGLEAGEFFVANDGSLVPL